MKLLVPGDDGSDYGPSFDEDGCPDPERFLFWEGTRKTRFSRRQIGFVRVGHTDVPIICEPRCSVCRSSRRDAIEDMLATRWLSFVDRTLRRRAAEVLGDRLSFRGIRDAIADDAISARSIARHDSLHTNYLSVLRSAIVQQRQAEIGAALSRSERHATG